MKSINEKMDFRNSSVKLLHSVLLIAELCFAHLSAAAEAPHRTIYLETLELRGTTRLTSDQLQKTLRLKTGEELSDDYVSEMRARLLSLGLFKDAVFALQKGTAVGKARLLITVEDDDSVVGGEALGGEFGLLVSEPERTIGDDSPFRSYHFGLIARNLFRSMHRAAINADMDPKGTVTIGSAAYGLPRFAAEGIQFDAGIAVSDPTVKYLETQAFGMKIQSLWSRSQRWWDVQYGAAWYSNAHNRYRLAGWPEVVAGPKLGIVHETRFMGFIPGEGWRGSIGLIPSLVKRGESVAECQLGGTLLPVRFVAISAELQSTTVGKTGVTTREELRLDVPITDARSEGVKATAFAKLRQGQDRYQEYSIVGSDAVIGIRYHSSGFIGELSFQVTQKNPLQPSLPPVPKANDDLPRSSGVNSDSNGDRP